MVDADDEAAMMKLFEFGWARSAKSKIAKASDAEL